MFTLSKSKPKQPFLLFDAYKLKAIKIFFHLIPYISKNKYTNYCKTAI